MSYPKSKDMVFKTDRDFSTPAASIGTGAKTITIAQMLTEILEEDPAGAATWTLPTAALMYSSQYIRDGSWFDFYVVNSATTTVDEPITVAIGSGGTLVGHGVVQANSVAGEESSGSAHFRVHVTSISAYTCYRLA